MFEFRWDSLKSIKGCLCLCTVDEVLTAPNDMDTEYPTFPTKIYKRSHSLCSHPYWNNCGQDVEKVCIRVCINQCESLAGTIGSANGKYRGSMH